MREFVRGMRSLVHKPFQNVDLIRDLTKLEVPKGGILMVHSSLRSIGYVEGGAETVVNALLEILGPEGTLVVPTFTDVVAARYPGFVFDPLNTPSYMGAITETIRRRRNARRSLHPWHSVAAIGPMAATLTTKGSESPWGVSSPMPQIASQNGMFLLLGVPYLSLTLAHLCEFELGVAYRPEMIIQVPMRRANGSIVPMVNCECPPIPGTPDTDYNRLGQRMEDAGMVRIRPVGNAVARLFKGSAVRKMANSLYKKDKKAFLKKGDDVTPLSYGHTIETSKGVHCVFDTDLIYNSD